MIPRPQLLPYYKKKKNNCPALNILHIGKNDADHTDILRCYEYLTHSNIFYVNRFQYNKIYFKLKKRLDNLNDKERLKIYTDTNYIDNNFVQNNFVQNQNQYKFDLIINDTEYDINNTDNLDDLNNFFSLYLPLLKEDGVLLLNNIQVMETLNYVNNILTNKSIKYSFNITF
jgi:hypothetical protein